MERFEKAYRATFNDGSDMFLRVEFDFGDEDRSHIFGPGSDFQSLRRSAFSKNLQPTATLK